ncbi:uncharacterized protein APUU_70057A [Aspergillus puulaauensis]|uniref:Epidermal growth factor receptor-like transmembrane-juxtamembrane segment domain-containing protein n=1 Tax=Aspergillus puulaauensis TaxID=1220207 RepID=A0A7R7XW23_9EURO|nr:uncharacterized protein APUU_70057A [Aspergillus puulaauensis]BCS28487.1 hypothetical protein APUU_70057A [Aspergillus puulaauensis]
MSEEVRAGWPVRRYLPTTEVCPPGEHGEKTWGQFFACCPDPSRPNVTDSGYRKCDLDSELGDLTPQPQCANSTWTLWTYESGYFCCDPTIGEQGYYYQSTGQLGCGTGDWISTADSDVRNAGNYPQPAVKKHSSTNKGAIAGGVVGGVCGALIIVGIIWFFLRRRRQSNKRNATEAFTDSSSYNNNTTKTQIESGPAELHEQSPVQKEMPADPHLRHELSGTMPAKQEPSELA